MEYFQFSVISRSRHSRVPAKFPVFCRAFSAWSLREKITKMERQDAAPPKKTFSPQALFSRERAFRKALLKLSRSSRSRSRALPDFCVDELFCCLFCPAAIGCGRGRRWMQNGCNFYGQIATRARCGFLRKCANANNKFGL